MRPSELYFRLLREEQSRDTQSEQGPGQSPRLLPRFAMCNLHQPVRTMVKLPYRKRNQIRALKFLAEQLEGAATLLATGDTVSLEPDEIAALKSLAEVIQQHLPLVQWLWQDLVSRE